MFKGPVYFLNSIAVGRQPKSAKNQFTKLYEYIEVELASIVSHGDELDVQPTASFQRVIQRAIIHTQSSGREVATGGPF